VACLRPAVVKKSTSLPGCCQTGESRSPQANEKDAPKERQFLALWASAAPSRPLDGKQVRRCRQGVENGIGKFMGVVRRFRASYQHSGFRAVGSGIETSYVGSQHSPYCLSDLSGRLPNHSLWALSKQVEKVDGRFINKGSEGAMAVLPPRLTAMSAEHRG